MIVKKEVKAAGSAFTITFLINLPSCFLVFGSKVKKNAGRPILKNEIIAI